MNMTAVEQNARQLVESIRLSEPYQEYLTAIEEIKDDAEKVACLNRVRRTYFERASEPNQTLLLEKLGELQTELADTFKQKWLIDFMEKEQRYCKLIQMVDTCLDDVMDFDMSFLKDQE